jgi:tetratricopeptide (TPR) repeat protein
MGARRAQSVAELGGTRRLVPGHDGRPGAEADCDAAGDDAPEPGTGEVRQEVFMARGIRAQCLADGLPPAEIALAIHERCEPTFGTTLIRSHRLALGIALADVVAQVRARYVTEGRLPPRFSETLLSSYEGGQKRPGPEYLHYLCNVYQAEPADLGYPGQCLCGRTHRAPASMPAAAATGSGQPPAAVAVPAPPQAVPASPQAVPASPQAVPASPQPGSAPPQDAAGAAAGAGQAGQAGQPAGVAMPVAESSPGEADDDLVRRNLLRLMADPGAEADGRFFGAAERIRRRLDDALLGATVSVSMLDHWEEMVAEYGRLYMTVPPMRLLCDVLLDLGDVRRMCEQRQPLEFVERLCQLAARLAGLAGMTMIDVGDQRLARSFFNTARTAADETGDRQLRAWVAVREALVPLYYGDPAQAAAAARASADLAGQRPCVASAMAPIVEARALARLARARGKGGAAGRAVAAGAGGAGGSAGMAAGAMSRVSAALEQAQAALDGLPAEERRGTAFGYTERQLLFHSGDALVTLGDYRGADDAFGQALRLYSPAEFLDRSLVTLGQARCRLSAGEPEEALRLSRETLARLPSQHRPGLVLRAAHSLGETVAAQHGDCPALRDYREALVGT